MLRRMQLTSVPGLIAQPHECHQPTSSAAGESARPTVVATGTLRTSRIMREVERQFVIEAEPKWHAGIGDRQEPAGLIEIQKLIVEELHGSQAHLQPRLELGGTEGLVQKIAGARL